MKLADALAKPEPIILDRSTLGDDRTCPLMGHLRRTQPVEDADRKHAARVGIAFHDVMEQYIDELVSANGRGSVAQLTDLALAGDARYQPELLHFAKLTGAKFRFFPQEHISHEKQYGYTLPKYGPHGEDVILTCRPDLVTWDGCVKAITVIDWKTGYGEEHDFQAMFYATVLWKSIEGIERVTWRPFRARKGTWGKPQVFGLGDSLLETSLPEAENIIKAAAMQYCQSLAADEWRADPGFERCQWCEYTRQCDACHSCFEADSIDDDPEAYLARFALLKQELANRADQLTAYVKASGPIEHDGHTYGHWLLSQKPTFGLRKGTPAWAGQEETDDE